MANNTDFGGINALGNISLTRNNNSITLRAPVSLSSTYTLLFPDALPVERRNLVLEANGEITLDTVTTQGLTSVGINLPTSVFSNGLPLTANGNLTATLISQNANTFFAAPSGTNGTPVFRSLVFADISSLVGAIANTVCAGNDSRLHTQNTDTGTSSQTFQIGSNNNGALLKNNAGVLQVRNSTDTQLGVLEVDELRARIKTISDTTVIDYQDAVLQLNSDFTTGTPTEDLGIEALRGSSPKAQILFTEANGWVAGIDGSAYKLVRKRKIQFTNADLSAGILTVNHNLGEQIPSVTIAKPGTVGGTFERVGSSDSVVYVSTNQLTVNLASFGAITGTWFVIVEG